MAARAGGLAAELGPGRGDPQRLQGHPALCRLSPAPQPLPQGGPVESGSGSEARKHILNEAPQAVLRVEETGLWVICSEPWRVKVTVTGQGLQEPSTREAQSPTVSVTVALTGGAARRLRACAPPRPASSRPGLLTHGRHGDAAAVVGPSCLAARSLFPLERAAPALFLPFSPHP